MVYKPPAPPLPPKFGKTVDRADLIPVLPTAKGGLDDAYTAVPRIDMPKKSKVLPMADLPQLKLAEPKKSSVGGFFGLALDVLDWGRAGIVSTLKEGIDLAQGEGFNFGDWKTQVNEHYGFGDLIHDERTAVGIGLIALSPFTAPLGVGVLADNIWVDRAVGIVGDFAVDPLMWLGGLPVFTRGLGWAGGIGKMGKTGMADTLMNLQQKGGWEKLVPKLLPLAKQQGVTLSKEGVEKSLGDAIVAAEKGRSASAISRSLRQTDMGKVVSDYFGFTSALRIRAPMTGPAGRMLRKDRWVERGGKLLGKSDDWFAKQQLKQVPPAYKAGFDTDDLVDAISLARKSGKGISRRASGAKGRAKGLKEQFAHVPDVDQFVETALRAARQPLEAFAIPAGLRKFATGGAVMSRLMDLPVAVARGATPDPVKNRLKVMFSREGEEITKFLKSGDPFKISFAANAMDNLRYALGPETNFQNEYGVATKTVLDRAGNLKIPDEDITDFLDTMMNAAAPRFGFTELDVTPRILREDSPFWEKLPQSIKDLPPDQYEILHRDLDNWVNIINKHTNKAYAGEDGIWKAAMQVEQLEGMPYRAPRRMVENARKRLLDPVFHKMDVDSYSATVTGAKVGGTKQSLPWDSHGYRTPASLKSRDRAIGQPVKIFLDADQAVAGTVGKTKIGGKDFDVLLNADGSVFKLRNPEEAGLSFRRQIDEAYERAFGEKAFEGKFTALQESYAKGMGRDIRMTHFMKRMRQYFPTEQFDDLYDELEEGLNLWQQATKDRVKKTKAVVEKEAKILEAKAQLATIEEGIAARENGIDKLSLKGQERFNELQKISLKVIANNAEVRRIWNSLEARGVEVERLLQNVDNTGGGSIKEWESLREELITEVFEMSNHAEELDSLRELMDELYTELTAAVKKEMNASGLDTPLPTSREGYQAVVDELETVKTQFDELTKERDELVDRLEVVSKEFDRNVEEIRVLSEQRATREEALPKMREQAESVKPKRTIEDVEGSAELRDLSNQERVLVRQIQSLDERMESVTTSLEAARKVGAVSKNKWERIQKTLKKAKEASKFLEDMNSRRNTKLGQLSRLREELDEVSDVRYLTREEEQFGGYAHELEAFRKEGRKVSVDRKEPPSGLNADDRKVWAEAHDDIKVLTEEIESLETRLRASEEAFAEMSAVGYRRKMANKSQKLAQIRKEKNRGPFAEGGAAEKKRLAKIAALEIDLEKNYKNIVHIERTEKQILDLSNKRTKLLGTKRKLRDKSQENIVRSKPRIEPEPDVLGQRDVQKLTTLRNRIKQLEIYEDGFGDLASEEAISSAQDLVAISDEIFLLEQELIIGMVSVSPRQGTPYSRRSIAAVRASLQERLNLLNSERFKELKKELLRGPRIEVEGGTGIPLNTQLFAQSADERWGLIAVPRRRTKDMAEAAGIPIKDQVLVRVQKISGNRWKVSEEIYEKDYLGEMINMTPDARQKFKDQDWVFYDEGVGADARALELTKVEQNFDDAEFLLKTAKEELEVVEAERTGLVEQIRSEKEMANSILEEFDELVEGGLRTKGRYVGKGGGHKGKTPDQTYRDSARRNTRNDYYEQARSARLEAETQIPSGKQGVGREAIFNKQPNDPPSLTKQLKQIRDARDAKLAKDNELTAPIAHWLEDPWEIGYGYELGTDSLSWKAYGYRIGKDDAFEIGDMPIPDVSEWRWIKQIMEHVGKGGEVPFALTGTTITPESLMDLYHQAARKLPSRKARAEIKGIRTERTLWSASQKEDVFLDRAVQEARDARDAAQRVFDEAQQNLEKFGVSRKRLKGRTEADERLLPVTPKKSQLARTGRPEGDEFTTNLPDRVAAAESDTRIMDRLRQERIVETGKLGEERAGLRRMISEMEAEMGPVESRVVKNVNNLEAQFQEEIDALRNTVQAIRDLVKMINRTAKNLDMETPAVKSMQVLSKFLTNLEKGILGTEGLTAPARMRDWMDRVAEYVELNKIFQHENFTAGSRNIDADLSYGQNLRVRERKWAEFQARTEFLEENYGIRAFDEEVGGYPFGDLGPDLKQARELKGLIHRRVYLAEEQQRLLKRYNTTRNQVEAKIGVQNRETIKRNNKINQIITLEQSLIDEEMRALEAATAAWELAVAEGKRLEAKTELIIKDLGAKSQRLGGAPDGATFRLRGDKTAPFEETLRNIVKDLGDTTFDPSALSKAGNATHKQRLESMEVLKEALEGSEWGPWALMNTDEAMNGDVAAVLNAFSRINDPVESAWMWKQWDKLQTWLKAGMIATPGFVERNVFGAFFNAWLDGVNPAEIVSMSKKVTVIANKAMQDRTNFYDAARAIAKSDRPDADLYDDIVSMLEVGVRGGGQAVSSVELEYGLKNARSLDMILGGKKGGRQVRVNAVRFWSPQWTPFTTVRTLNSWAEDIIRLGVGADTMRAGGNVDDALNRIAKTQFDYDELTEWERTWARRVIPFYTWTRKNLPYQLEKFWTQPYKYNRLMSIKRNLEMGTSPEGVVPDYYMEPFGIRLPFKWKGARVYTAPDFPFQDLFRYDPLEGGGPLSGVKNIAQTVLSSTSPIVKTPLEVGFGKQIFTGIPFTGRYQQAPNPITKIGPLMEVLDQVGMAEKSATGWKMRDHHIYLVNGMLPTVSLIRRMFPNERKYQRTHLRNLVSFLGGVNVNFNTPEVKYNWLEGQKWEKLSERQDAKDLLSRFK